MRITLSQSGLTTLSKLPALENYTASQVEEANEFSPALKNYLSFSPDALDRWHGLRNKAWIESTLATVLSTASSKDVCHSWSTCANLILRECFEKHFDVSSAALFALGKLGSLELNLSSDVDLLIIVKNESEHHLKGLRAFQKTLSERTPTGFIFRVDFDLRPGGRQGPILPTLDHFQDYYGNFGETWERMAFVRLSAIAGDAELINEVLTFAKKFTYRKHLDYTLLEDLKNLRGKIHTQYAPRSTEAQWDLKLGVGGIRDVELFTHALQVIHGGKNPQLQVSSTDEALRRLGDAKILPFSDVDFLVQHYWRLRHLENFAQSLNDEQTHVLAKSETLPSWGSAVAASLEEDLKTCDRIVSTLLGSPEAPKEFAVAMTPECESIWKEILSMEAQSRSKERDEQARLLFLQQFYQTLVRQKGNIEKALHHLRDFIKSTRAKASFFTLLVRNTSLLEEIAWLFGHSPYLSQILSSRPELIDSYVYRSQDLQRDDLALLLEQLVEKRLLAELINGTHFLEDHDVISLQKNLSDTADEICRTLFEELKKEYPSEMNILCLGKWGGRELGLRSDLDFIFVTPEEPNEVDAKLARRMINRLTELRKGGSIFAIDMRLKPSGKAGPMVISYPELQAYLLNEAEAWERQAYLKARWLFESSLQIQQRYLAKGLSTDDLVKLEKIREGLVRSTTEDIDLKYAEGGLLDVELFAQAYVLENPSTFRGVSTEDLLMAVPNSEPLRTHYLRLRQIEQMWQLLFSQGGSRLQTNHESFQQLAKTFLLVPSECKKEILGLLDDAIVTLNQLDPRRQKTILSSV